MRTLTAAKTNTQEMMEVTGKEATQLIQLNEWISVGDYDKENTKWDSDEIVGYIAGNINALIEVGEEQHVDPSAYDCWFINKEFFETNYEEIK